MVLGRGLARARERMGYRRGDAAAALGVARAMISCWENGRREPNDPQMAALAGLYRIDVASLLSGEFGGKSDEAEMLFREAGTAARPGIQDFLDFLDRYERLAELVGVELRGMHASLFRRAEGQGRLMTSAARRRRSGHICASGWGPSWTWMPSASCSG